MTRLERQCYLGLPLFEKSKYRPSGVKGGGGNKLICKMNIAYLADIFEYFIL